jgi:prepilin peptidase CpaA
MSGVCIETTTTPVNRNRQIAWQLALVLPLLILILCSVLQYDATQLWQTPCGLILLSLVIVSAITDLLWCKIPNWATYSAFGWAIAINSLALFVAPEVASKLGAVGLTDCLAGAFIPFFFMLVVFSMTGGGAGDVKLTAAMGAFLGLGQVVDAILLSFIFAGGFALIRAVWVLGPWNLVQLVVRSVGSWLLPLWVQPPNKEQSCFMRQPMPLGPSFALGVGMVVFNLNVQKLIELLSTSL